VAGDLVVVEGAYLMVEDVRKGPYGSDRSSLVGLDVRMLMLVLAHDDRIAVLVVGVAAAAVVEEAVV